MKKLIYALLTTFFSAVFAQNTLAAYEGPIFLRKSYGRQSLNSYGPSQWSHQLSQNWWTGTYEFSSGDNNETTADGAASFYRSRSSATAQVWIHHDISGYVAATVNNSTTLQNLSTEVVADPGKTITALSGHAIALGDNHSGNDNVGTWKFTGGDWSAGSGHSALYARKVNSVTIDSASFYAGSGNPHHGVYVESGTVTITNSRERDDIVYAATADGGSSDTGSSGLHVNDAATISGGGSFLSQVSQNGFRSDSSLTDNVDNQGSNVSGLSGATFTSTATFSGDRGFYFLGSDAGDSALTGGIGGSAAAYGGSGIGAQTLNGSFTNSTFIGGNAGRSEIVDLEYITAPFTYTNSSENSSAYSHGGNGITANAGTVTISDSEGYGGVGGNARANDAGNYADATGGNGLYTGGTMTINGGTYEGGNAGTAISELGEAYAFGGNGVMRMGSGTLTINGGTYIGGNGGSAQGSIAVAEGGAGVRVSGGTLNINGGTFTGGREGKANKISETGNLGILVSDADLTVTENTTNTLINGNVAIQNNTTKSATFTSGTLTEDLYFEGTGTTTLKISTNFIVQGSYNQSAGTVNFDLSNEQEGTALSEVNVNNGTLAFSGEKVVTAEEASYLLGDEANVSFSDGIYLSEGSSMNIGYGSVNSSGGTIELADYSSVGLLVSTSFDTNGVASYGGGSLAGDVVITNSTAKFSASGIAARPNDTIQITTGSFSAGTNSIADVADVEFGFLTETTLSDSSGLLATVSYSSLSNSLTDMDATYLGYYDTMIQTNLTEEQFFQLNKGGAEQIRYGISQIPDVSESSFKVSQQVNDQIAARGTEYRSMNGFASTKPKFNNTPAGVAGPEKSLDEEKTMQGWIRAYGATGNRDADGNFDEYDSSSWGTVIGVDKNFGNLLVGLAGGYSDASLDGSYRADVKTYHGSLYSTFGGEAFFVDLALTYGIAETEEKSSAGIGKFDSDLYSAYIGAGYAFDLGQKISLTPVGSLLASYYDQEEYDRSGIFSGTIQDYDTTSLLGTLGVNLATQHQIDWLNRGIAYIPEVRLHYIREFNSDPDDVTFVAGGIATPFAVRPRDENLFRVGFGLDMWSWRYQNAKFEIDYDGLFSDKYYEHVVSGKATWRF